MEPSIFRVQVDESRVNRAIAELWTALAGQNVVYAQRFERGIFSPASQRFLRGLALVLCATGLALSGYILASVPVGCGSFGFGLMTFAAFGIFGLGFFRVFEIQASMQKRARRWVGKVLRKRANKTLAPMRDASPVEVEYTVDNDRVIGRWLRAGRTERDGMRKRDSVASGGATVCAIFAKKTAQHPRVVMVHTDRASLAAMLEARGVEVAPLPLDLPDEYGVGPDGRTVR
jgi:hypothetical protein